VYLLITHNTPDDIGAWVEIDNVVIKTIIINNARIKRNVCTPLPTNNTVEFFSNSKYLRISTYDI